MPETSEFPFPFIPPRRSPLKSSTFHTLVRILSLSIDEYSRTPPLVSQVPRTCTNLSKSSPVSVDSSANVEIGNPCFPEPTNSLAEKKPVLDVNSNSGSNQNGYVGDGVIVLEESKQVEQCDDIELGNLLTDKGPILDGKSDVCLNIVSKQDGVFGDGLIVSEQSKQGKHSDDIEFSKISIQKGPIVDGNPKMVNKQNEISPYGRNLVGELRRVADFAENEEFADDSVIGFKKLSAVKRPIADRNPEKVDTQSETSNDEGTRFGELQKMESRAEDEKFVHGSAIEYEKLTRENGGIADENPKTVDTQHETYPDGDSLVGEIEQVENCKQNKKVVYGSVINGLPTKENTVIGGGVVLNGMVELVDGKGKEGIEQLPHHLNNVKPLVSFTQKDLIVEEVLESANDSQHDAVVQGLQNEGQDKFYENGRNRSLNFSHNDLVYSVDTQNKEVDLEQVLEGEAGRIDQEGQSLEKLVSLDLITESSRLGGLGEVVFDKRNHSVSLMFDKEIEDGEISDSEAVSGQAFDSIPADGISEAWEVEEEQVFDDSKGKGEASHVWKEHMRVHEENMASVSCLAGSSCLAGNCMIGNSKGKGTIEKSKMLVYDGKMAMLDFGNDGVLRPGYVEMGCRKQEEIGALEVSPNSLGFRGEATKRTKTQDQELISTVQDVKVQEKKRRGPLTEERKSKKKLAKKRKRAQMNRKQGVKRLKLQPISKPKVVIDCKFYLNGRCQQGDKCKFSHDCVPLTKSQPCKYLACHSCLKGDDCPFDHELSKYPCHSYMSKGYCSRGDACLFSHKIRPTEGTSGTLEGSNTESRLPSAKPNSRKQLNISCSSNPLLNQLFKDAAPGTTSSLEGHLSKTESQFPLDKPNSRKQLDINYSSNPLINELFKEAAPNAPSSLESHLNRQKKDHASEMIPKTPANAPEGLTFLSFGQAPSHNNIEKNQDNIPSKKHDGVEVCNSKNLSEKDKLKKKSSEVPCLLPGSALSSHRSLISSGYVCKSSPISAQKANLSTPTFDRTLLNTSFDAASNSSLRSQLVSVPGDGMPKSRSTEASKILEEFLFGEF